MKTSNFFSGWSKDEILNELAKASALNMVDTATFNSSENFDATSILLTKAVHESRYGAGGKQVMGRNVLIIGAGCSADVNRNIVTAPRVPDMITDKLDGGLRQRFMDELDRIVKTDKLNPKDPLTKFKALRGVKDEQYLRRELKALLSYRYQTSLFYELVAHMFKHGMIDIIINYNFDEILDNIIEEEMGQTRYAKILMNGQCPDDFRELHIEGKLTTPIYIKPHGTISHINSLKFTNDHFFAVKDERSRMQKLLLSLFKENYIDNNTVTQLPVNIIAAGYAFNDLDLKDTIIEAQAFNNRHFPGSGKFSIYIFDIAERLLYLRNSDYLSEIAASVGTPVNYVQLSRASGLLGDLFKDIWAITMENFQPALRNKYIKDIARHELMAALFHRPDDPEPVRYMPDEDSETVTNYERNNSNFKAYLEKKIFIEIAIVIGKSEGIIHISQFKESRVRKYCNLYFEKFGNGFFHNLKQFLKFFKGIDTYEETLHDTFILTRDYKTGNTINYAAIWRDVCKPLGIARPQSQIYEELFVKICNGKLCIINSDLGEYNVSEFNGLRRQNLLYSDIRWLFKFMMLFHRVEWNTLLCISENGEVLMDDFYIEQLRLSGKKIEVKMILSDYRKCRTHRLSNFIQQKKLPENIDVEIRKLPWELHNKHMYIFMNITPDGKRQDVAGIFYVRRLLSSKVNPVFIEGGDNNIEMLFDSFVNYWTRSLPFDSFEEVRMYYPNSDLSLAKRTLLAELSGSLRSVIHCVYGLSLNSP
ncbi:MAG: SIR2 family protein [Bacteroidota bacterium]|nr:SIR2 family protein [Bacteroidota bacterium]